MIPPLLNRAVTYQWPVDLPVVMEMFSFYACHQQHAAGTKQGCCEEKKPKRCFARIDLNLNSYIVEQGSVNLDISNLTLAVQRRLFLPRVWYKARDSHMIHR